MMDMMAIEYKQNAVDTVLYRGRSSSYKHPVAQYAPVCARCCMDRKLHPQTKPPFLTIRKRLTVVHLAQSERAIR